MRFLVSFAILYGLWLIFSGLFDCFHLSLGFICCTMVSTLSGKLLFSTTPTTKTFIRIFRFILYLPWLLLQIIIANLQVAYLVLHPKMLITPEIIRLKTNLKEDVSQVIMANSITLTPGTITVDIEEGGNGGQFVVHSLSKMSSGGLEDMAGKVSKI